MSGTNNSVETVNAAATAIAAAESRVQQVTSPRRRWGGWLSMYWCFGSHRQTKRINHAVVIPETTASESAPVAPENIHHSSSLTLPFVAPPSSPASFLQSEPSSSVQSPVGLFSLTALSANSYSPVGPRSIFAIGPYAHETQLVSPPVFSTFTTEPSTAPFTPPPESVHLTTPSSPEVPFAQLLMSSLDSSLKKSEGYEFRSYHLYPGSPIGQLISPSSVCSGTSSPLPDLESQYIVSGSFSSFPTCEPPKLLTAEGLSMRKMMPRQSSEKGLPIADVQDKAVDSVGDLKNTSNIITVMNHRLSFELTDEEVARYLEKEPATRTRLIEESHTDAKELAEESSHSKDDKTSTLGCHGDETDHDLSDKLQPSTPDRAAKEFKFDNADGTSEEPTVGSDWWANEKVIGTETGASKNWAFFPIKQPGVS